MPLANFLSNELRLNFEMQKWKLITREIFGQQRFLSLPFLFIFLDCFRTKHLTRILIFLHIAVSMQPYHFSHDYYFFSKYFYRPYGKMIFISAFKQSKTIGRIIIPCRLLVNTL